MFGAWGPEIGGFYIVPALVGAVILIFIVSFAMRSMKK
ncbi:GlsB/YeaQ/YmgE family stress response membrane protein [uncultured Trichococcus sp.]|nr:GlsB/YeaQ/YmgE family stress response membrane protein [uncultured Trichococcus sp.]